jgi:hypothetical protein
MVKERESGMEEKIKLVSRGGIGCGGMLYKGEQSGKKSFDISTMA